jgi:LAO/AO transport system kinase
MIHGVTTMSGDVAGMVQRLAGGDVRALARAVSLVEDGDAVGTEVVRACRARGLRGRRIGVTGSAGAGKSTLVDQMVRVLRARGERVGVVAVDPTSPYTGGALLGDRIRMQGFDGDAGVYIRSMASRGGVGGVSAGVDGVCAVLEAAGFGIVVIETVGVGQDEVAVTGLADVTVLVVTPGMGDDVQSLKAGVMEAADVFVVNKADLPGADAVEAEIRAMQSLTGDSRAVLRTVGLTGVGVEELVSAVMDGSAYTDKRDKDGLRRMGLGGVRLDHLGVAVRSIAAARGFYEGLGLRVEHEETVEFEQVRTAMLPMGESRIELLEATAEDSTIGRFVDKRGEGLHHIAIRVEGIEGRFAEMKASGVRLASDSVRVGAGGHRYFFVHPASTGGVLVELVGD